MQPYCLIGNYSGLSSSIIGKFSVNQPVGVLFCVSRCGTTSVRQGQLVYTKFTFQRTSTILESAYFPYWDISPGAGFFQ